MFTIKGDYLHVGRQSECDLESIILYDEDEHRDEDQHDVDDDVDDDDDDDVDYQEKEEDCDIIDEDDMGRSIIDLRVLGSLFFGGYLNTSQNFIIKCRYVPKFHHRVRMMFMSSLVHSWQRQGWERVRFCIRSGRPENLCRDYFHSLPYPLPNHHHHDCHHHHHN